MSDLKLRPSTLKCLGVHCCLSLPTSPPLLLWGSKSWFGRTLLPSHLPVGLPFNFWLSNCLPGVSDVLPVHSIYFSTTWAWCFCTPGHPCLDGRTHTDKNMFHHWINKKPCFLFTFILDLLTLSSVWSFENVWQGSSCGPDIRGAGPVDRCQRPICLPTFQKSLEF